MAAGPVRSGAATAAASAATAAASAATAATAPPDARSTFAFEPPLDLRRTLAPLRHGHGDLTVVFGPEDAWLALRTPAGPATLRLAAGSRELLAEAWGPGAATAVERAQGLAGLLDDPTPLVPRHPLVRDLALRFAGLRLPRTLDLVAALVPAVTEQKVTAIEAHSAYASILRRLGEPAPGPTPRRMLLPPDPLRLAALPSYDFHPLGLERKRAELLRRIARLAPAIESFAGLPPEDARAALQRVPGIGPWTAAEATRIALGDPDAVSIGDAHIPSMVSWALAREPRADDARMLELLEPYPGQRARVIRLLEAAGIMAPRRAPRFSPRQIRSI